MPDRSGHTSPVSSAPDYSPESSNHQPGYDHGEYSLLVDNIPAILWRANAQTLEFTFVTRYAQSLLGYQLEQWTEPSFWNKHLCAEDKEHVLDCRGKAVKNGEPYDIEYRLIAHDGRPLWVREFGQTHEFQNGTPELAGVIVDLSQKRSSKEEASAVFRTS